MSVWKKIILFIVANAFVVGFFFIAPKYPLQSMAVLLLLIANFLCYLLLKARADRDISQIKANVGNKEVTTSIQLLRYAASALAFISFITTAEGLHEFVFTGEKVWQAYLVSFAVQSILLVFNFLFFQFYIRINNLESFPLFLKRVLTYFVVLLFTVALIISSTFSFVFIANNTYLSMRAKNSNITIERFLKDETHRLKTINDSIGRDLKKDITDRTEELQKIISEQSDITASANETNINNVLSNFSITKCIEVTDEFYTQEELNTDVNYANPEEYQTIHSTLTTYKDTYNLIYNDYLSAYNFYDNLKKAPNKSQYTNETALKAQIALLDTASGSIDSNLHEISELRSRNHVNDISQYKQKALAAFNNLKSGIQSLRSLYKTILPEYQVIAKSISTSEADFMSVKGILNVVYTDVYNETMIQKIQAFLSGMQEVLVNTDTIDEEKLEDLAGFIEAFNDFAEYTKLNEQINEFINDDLSITYYIKGENETDAPMSDEKLKVVSEADWTKERKEDFTKFISYLKLLPDIEAHKEKYKESAVKDYEPEQVLQSAYTINRDLLENISGFEKAINYFKYDFGLMAVFSLAMALFLDVASFLTGGFMFSASFFNDEKKEEDPTNNAEQMT